MSPGRCPGCGYVNGSCRKVNNHMASCPALAQLYKTDPSRVVPPEAEYRRWKETEEPEAKQEAREDWLTKRFQDLDTRREAQAVRWQPKDILDD